MFEVVLKRNWDERVQTVKHYQVPKSEKYASLNADMNEEIRSGSLDNRYFDYSGVQTADPIRFSTQKKSSLNLKSKQSSVNPFDHYDKKLK